MTRNAAYFTTMLLLAAQVGFVSKLAGQSRPDQFLVPQGWELVDNWVTPFQETFGLDADMGDFFALQSESDFLLYHAGKQAFLIVWEAPIPPHEVYTGRNELISQPVWGLKTRRLQATEYLFPADPAQSGRLHMIAVSTRRSINTSAFTQTVSSIAASYAPDTIQMMGANCDNVCPAAKLKN